MANLAADILEVARAARALDQQEAALLLFRRVRELDARNLEALAAIAELAETLGEADEARDARLDLVELHIGAGKLQPARELVDKVLAASPDHPLARSFGDFIDRRLNPEAGIAEATPAPVDDEITRKVAADVDEGEWEARTTAVISAANMQELLAGSDPAEDEAPVADEWQARATAVIGAANMQALLAEAAPPVDDFDAPNRTIALGGAGAEAAMAALVGTSPLLRALDSAGCTRLLAEAEVVQCFADQEIAEQGTPGQSMFLVIEGRAVAERSGRTLEVIGPGSFFGEAALIGETPRLATLRVSEDSTLLEIDRSLIKSLSATQPRLLQVLGHVLRARAIAVQVAESPVLRRVPINRLRELASLLHLHKIRRGQELVSAGQVASGYWEVVVGLLEAVDAEGAAGSDLAAGRGFGLGCLRGEPSAVTLTAITPSWLLELPAKDLAALVDRSPELAGAFELG